MKELWAQAAWADSRTNQLRLTYAIQHDVPSPLVLSRAMGSVSIPVPHGGFQPWLAAPKYLPMLRYTY